MSGVHRRGDRPWRKTIADSLNLDSADQPVVERILRGTKVVVRRKNTSQNKRF